jgi:hypothetical protein
MAGMTGYFRAGPLVGAKTWTAAHAVSSDPVLGREQSRELELQPQFVPPGQLASLDLHPALAGHLNRILDPVRHGHAAYVGNVWR